jgi:hypothetical protein
MCYTIGVYAAGLVYLLWWVISRFVSSVYFGVGFFLPERKEGREGRRKEGRKKEGRKEGTGGWKK